MITGHRLVPFFIFVTALLAARATPARADVLLEQLPTHGGGPGADTSFYSDFGIPIYQVTADDFQFSEMKEVRSLRWWGFYGGNFGGSHQPPVGD
jgi:hypothetical protein